MSADGDEVHGAWCGCGDPHVNDVQKLYDAHAQKGSYPSRIGPCPEAAGLIWVAAGEFLGRGGFGT